MQIIIIIIICHHLCQYLCYNYNGKLIISIILILVIYLGYFGFVFSIICIMFSIIFVGYNNNGFIIYLAHMLGCRRIKQENSGIRRRSFRQKSHNIHVDVDDGTKSVDQRRLL